jgi:PAS domain S-box-containing protein
MTGQPERVPVDFLDYLRNYHIRTFRRAIGAVVLGVVLLAALDRLLVPTAARELLAVRALSLVPIGLIYALGFRRLPSAVIPWSLAIAIILGVSVTASLRLTPEEMVLPVLVLGYFLTLLGSVLLFPLRPLEYGILVAAVYASYLVVDKPRVPGQSIFLLGGEDALYFSAAAIGLLALILRNKGLALGYLGDCYRHDVEAANVELHLQRQELEAAGRALEQTVAERTRLLQTVLDAAPATVIGLDPDGRIAVWNRAVSELTGVAASEAVGKSFLDLVRAPGSPFTEAWVDAFRVCLAQGAFVGQIGLAPSADGGRTLVGSGRLMRDGDGNPMGLVLCAHDVSDRARLERELIHSQRMEIIGQLAGGVTHSFNNLLVGILAVAQGLLKRDLSDDLRAGIARIERYTWNASKVAEQFLTFSRKDGRKTRREDLSDVVRRSVDLLAQVKKRGVTLDVEVPENGLTAELDAADIEQAVLNVLMNANYAVSADGRIRVALARVRFAEQELSARCWAKAGVDYARVEIADNGPGIAKEVLAHIFEPFFTTKPEGMGMGLAISRSIVKAHRGRLWASANRDRGCTFHFTLPTGRRS